LQGKSVGGFARNGDVPGGSFTGNGGRVDKSHDPGQAPFEWKMLQKGFGEASGVGGSEREAKVK